MQVGDWVRLHPDHEYLASDYGVFLCPGQVVSTNIGNRLYVQFPMHHLPVLLFIHEVVPSDPAVEPNEEDLRELL